MSFKFYTKKKQVLKFNKGPSKLKKNEESARQCKPIKLALNLYIVLLTSSCIIFLLTKLQ